MQTRPYSLLLANLELWLLPERALYLPQSKTLVIADWHLGKIAHFRKNGLFVPQTALIDEFQALEQLIHTYSVERVVFLGDLFHSSWNEDWDQFTRALQPLKHIEFILTLGNHDLVDFNTHGSANLTVVPHLTIASQVVLSHEVLPGLAAETFNIVGHTHPGVLIKGPAKQHYRLPCFYLEAQVFILPAFGKFTGLQLVDPQAKNQIYAILGNEIRLLKNKKSR